MELDVDDVENVWNHAGKAVGKKGIQLRGIDGEEFDSAEVSTTAITDRVPHVTRHGCRREWPRHRPGQRLGTPHDLGHCRSCCELAQQVQEIVRPIDPPSDTDRYGDLQD